MNSAYNHPSPLIEIFSSVSPTPHDSSGPNRGQSPHCVPPSVSAPHNLQIVGHSIEVTLHSYNGNVLVSYPRIQEFAKCKT